MAEQNNHDSAERQLQEDAVVRAAYAAAKAEVSEETIAEACRFFLEFKGVPFAQVIEELEELAATR